MRKLALFDDTQPVFDRGVASPQENNKRQKGLSMALLSADIFTPDMVEKRAKITIVDRNLGLLKVTHFHANALVNQAIVAQAERSYAHMLSGQQPREQGKRPCTIFVNVFKPISDEQSKELNNQRAKNSNMAGGAAAGIVTVLTRSKLAGMGAGALAREAALDAHRAWDSGDILVRIEANVSGGIGPQKHSRSIVIKRSAYGGS